MRNIILCGGGTGGHIYPALAIGEGLRKAYPDACILYAGTPQGPEKELAQAAGFSFLPIDAAGLPSKPSVKTVKSLMATWRGYRQAKKMIMEKNPALVIGTGGYVCGPVVLAAAKKEIPTLLHEQNAVAGKTNRMLSQYVDKICLTFQEAENSFSAEVKKKTVLTGLPVRDCFWHADKTKAQAFFHLDPSKVTIFETGGSQGAQSLNRALSAIYPDLLQMNCQIIHAVGKKNIAEMKEVCNNLGLDEEKGLFLYPYLQEMDLALAASDIVLSRAGASFLAELCAVGRAAILVPYPFAANDHQRANANSLVKGGAAVLLEDMEMNKETLLATLKPLMQDREKRQEMARKMATFGKRDALQKILDECAALLK